MKKENLYYGLFCILKFRDIYFSKAKRKILNSKMLNNQNFSTNELHPPQQTQFVVSKTNNKKGIYQSLIHSKIQQHASSKNQTQIKKFIFKQEKSNDITTCDHLQKTSTSYIGNKQFVLNARQQQQNTRKVIQNQQCPSNVNQTKIMNKESEHFQLCQSKKKQKCKFNKQQEISLNQKEVSNISDISEIKKKKQLIKIVKDFLILNNNCENIKQFLKNQSQTLVETLYKLQISKKTIIEALIKLNFERVAGKISILHFLQKKPEIGEIIIVNNLVKTTLELFRVEAKLNDTKKSSLYYLQNLIRFGIVIYYLITIFQIQIFYHSNPSLKRLLNYLQLLTKKYKQVRKIIQTCCKETRELFEIFYKGNSCRQILNQKQIEQLCKSLRLNEISYLVFIQLIIKEIQKQLLAIYKKLIAELSLS